MRSSFRRRKIHSRKNSSSVKAPQDQLAVLKTKYEEAVTSCCHLKNKYDGAREDSLQQHLKTEEDWQETKASLNHQSSEDKCCKEVSQLKELLKQKDQEVQRLTKNRQMRTKAFCDILYPDCQRRMNSRRTTTNVRLWRRSCR